MDLLVFFRTLRRRWVLLLVLTVAGAALGVASGALDSSGGSTGRASKATTTLVLDTGTTAGGQSGGFQSLDQLAIFVTTGDVPVAVARQLGSAASGPQLAQRIVTTTNPSTSTLAITAVATGPDEAVALADAFA
jgi:capsular polysaccharide biosynthesis protein